MTVSINGKPHPMEKPRTLTDLLADLGLTGRPLIIEHNGIALVRSEWETTLVSPDDRLEFVQLVAGG
jgi:sulfur carrier protein